jgi:hypothetical protein
MATGVARAKAQGQEATSTANVAVIAFSNDTWNQNKAVAMATSNIKKTKIPLARSASKSVWGRFKSASSAKRAMVEMRLSETLEIT